LTTGADGAAVAPALVTRTDKLLVKVSNMKKNHYFLLQYVGTHDMASKYDLTAEAEPWIEEVVPIADK
jgi:hypothetical protein